MKFNKLLIGTTVALLSFFSHAEVDPRLSKYMEHDYYTNGVWAVFATSKTKEEDILRVQISFSDWEENTCVLNTFVEDDEFKSKESTWKLDSSEEGFYCGVILGHEFEMCTIEWKQLKVDGDAGVGYGSEGWKITVYGKRKPKPFTQGAILRAICKLRPENK